MDSFAKRFSKILSDNHLNQQIASEKTGMSQPVISNLLNDKIDKKYKDFDNAFNICENDDQKYYLATGKHLPEQTPQAPPPTPNCTNEIKMLSNTIKDLSQIISHLIAEMSDLKAELRSLKGVNESQGLVTHTGSKVKVPDH